MTNEQRDTLAKETHDAVIRMDAEFAAYRELVTKVAATVYGNGTPGLCSKVHLLMWVLGVGSAVGIIVLGAVAVKAFAG